MRLISPPGLKLDHPARTSHIYVVIVLMDDLYDEPTIQQTSSSRTADQRNEQAPPAPGAGELALHPLEMAMKP